jgi:hypothetical protein
MRVKLALIVLGLTLFVTSISSAPAQTKFKPTEVRTTLFPYNQEWGRLQNKISFSSDGQYVLIDVDLKNTLQWRDVKTLNVSKKIDLKGHGIVHVFSNQNRILTRKIGGIEDQKVRFWRMTDQDGNVLWNKPSPFTNEFVEVDAVERNIYWDGQLFDLAGNEVPYVGMSDGEVYDKILKLYDDSWKDKSNDFRINYGYIIKSNNANRFIYSKDERYFFDDFSIFYYNASKNKLEIMGGRNKIEYDAYWKNFKGEPCRYGIKVGGDGLIVSQCIDKNSNHQILVWSNRKPTKLIRVGKTQNSSKPIISQNNKYFALITDTKCYKDGILSKPISCEFSSVEIGNVRIYNSKTYELIAKLPNAGLRDSRLSFSPDGKKIAYLGSINGNVTLHIWTLEP